MKRYLTLRELAERWSVSRWTAGRIMARCGCSGLKMSDGRSGGRRFRKKDVREVERRMGRGGAGGSGK